MKNAKPQAGLGRRHVRDPEDLERGQHDHQAAGQNTQPMALQARQLELFDMPHFEQAQRQAQQSAIGDTALAVIVQAVGLEHFGQHPRSAGRADGLLPTQLAVTTRDLFKLQRGDPLGFQQRMSGDASALKVTRAQRCRCQSQCFR